MWLTNRTKHLFTSLFCFKVFLKSTKTSPCQFYGSLQWIMGNEIPMSLLGGGERGGGGGGRGGGGRRRRSKHQQKHLKMTTSWFSDSPGLQVAMETQQDALSLAVKVEQRCHQSRQLSDPVHLRGEGGGTAERFWCWIIMSCVGLRSKLTSFCSRTNMLLSASSLDETNLSHVCLTSSAATFPLRLRL